METNKDYKINRYFFLAIILIFAFLLLMSLIQFFIAFLSAVIFYILSKPSLDYLVKRRRWKKSRAAILVIIVSFFIILIFFLTFPLHLRETNKVQHKPSECLNNVVSSSYYKSILETLPHKHN